MNSKSVFFIAAVAALIANALQFTISAPPRADLQAALDETINPLQLISSARFSIAPILCSGSDSAKDITTGLSLVILSEAKNLYDCLRDPSLSLRATGS